MNELNEITEGTKDAIEYLTEALDTQEQKDEAIVFIKNMVRVFGPVVQGYPSWHPLMTANLKNNGSSSIYEQDHYTPERLCGYDGVDHTVKFANAFITCPYNTLRINDSIADLRGNATSEELSVKLYTSNAKPVVVYADFSCDCDKYEIPDCVDFDNIEDEDREFKKIPQKVAIPLMMKHELRNCDYAQCSETWADMRDYLLGRPNKNTKSLFLNQEDGRAIKSMYLAMCKTGMFGDSRN